MHVITLAQQKGGVGKTTLAIHLAAEAVRKGERAAILEMDRQGTASQWSDARAPVSDEGDLLNPVDNAKKPPEVLQVGMRSLGGTLAALANRGCEVVFIDLPGTHSPSVNEAIRRADLVLIPARPAETDIGASGDTLAVAHRFERPYAYVLTLWTVKDRAEEAREALEDEGHIVAPGAIAHRVAFQDAVSRGVTVQEMEPNGKSAIEIRQLWRWIRDRIQHDKREVG